MKTHYNMVIQCQNLISLYILPDQRRVNLPSTVFSFRSDSSMGGATSLWGSTRGLFVLLYDEIKNMKTHYNMVIQCQNLISLYILPDQRRVNLPSTVFSFRSDSSMGGATSLWGSTRGLFVLLYDEIKIMKTH